MVAMSPWWSGLCGQDEQIDHVRRRWLAGLGASACLSACGRPDTHQPPPAGTQPNAADMAPLLREPGELIGHGIVLPGLIDDMGRGPMMTLVREVFAAVPEVRLRLDALPLKRVMHNILHGHADFAFPDLRVPGSAPMGLNYHWSLAPMGRVWFLLYSRATDPVDRRRIESLLSIKPFPLEIEAPPGVDFGFPTKPITSLHRALSKVNAGRMDALLWAQEEADIELRRLGFTGLVRTPYDVFDDVLMITNSEYGTQAERAWSQGVERLSRNGRMASLYAKVHRPYDPWQPSEMAGTSESLREALKQP